MMRKTLAFLAKVYLVFGDSGRRLKSKSIFTIIGDMNEGFPD
jgi:hypothetical protein